MLKVGLCGFGYWGPKLFRNLTSHASFQMAAVADQSPERRGMAEQLDPNLRLFDSAEEMIDSAGLDAVVVATPVATHHALAQRAIEKGKHVLVEKPICASVAEAEDLVARAKAGGVTLMVDHTFLFTGAVQSIRDIYREGQLGHVSYYDSMRVNLGLFQPDINVLWDLAPHDFAIMDFILDDKPVHIEATGYSHVNPQLPDIAYVTLHFASDMVAHFNLSWMSPVKVRRTAIGGSKSMLVWDDLNREEKIKIYNTGIVRQPQDQRDVIIPDYRIGDIFSPRVSNREALMGVVTHFADVIAGTQAPLMDGERGLRVVAMLEEAQKALDTSLDRVTTLRATPS